MIEQRNESAVTTAEIAGAAQRKFEMPDGPHSSAVIDESSREALFASNEAQDFRSKWEKIQVGFVDEPRKAVQDADGLVAAAIKRLAEVFAEERSKLEHEWDRGDSVSTEDLRIALRRYRSFFDRLLSI